MADNIEVNITTLEQDAKSMSEVLKKIQNDMTSMFSLVQELDTMWDGPSNAVFVAQVKNDVTVFDAVCTAVDGVIDSMNNAKDSYRKCETAVGTEIDRIRI